MQLPEIFKNKKFLIILAISIIILIILLIFILKYQKKEEVSVYEGTALFTRDEEIINVTLYFEGDDDKEFAIESREIYKTKSIVNRAKQAVIKLIEGPKTDKASAIIPKGTKLRELYIENGHAYVDFSKEFVLNHPGGSKAETATIGGIVNSLIKNFSEIEDVKILIEGKEENTLAGHIDIRQPFKEMDKDEKN